MTKEPWDLPNEDASKPTLETLIHQYEAAEQAREVGICCSRMASLLKQIGPMDEAAIYGQKAIWYLRQTEDKKELSRALRVACIPFTSGPYKEYLEESLAIAREIGDKEEEGWTLFRLTKALSTGGKSIENFIQLMDENKEQELLDEMEKMKAGKAKNYRIEDALAVFEEINDKSGIATCLVSLGVERKPSDRALFDRAITLYDEVGETEAANKTRMMADVFAPLPQPWDLPEEPDSRVILATVMDGFRESNQRRELGMCLWRMSNLAALFGSLDPIKNPIDYARESIVCFRQSSKGTEYCLALEQAAKAAADQDETLANLEELVSYSEEIGEPNIHARALFALVTQFPKAVKDLSGALEYFEDMEDEAGIAACKSLMP